MALVSVTINAQTAQKALDFLIEQAKKYGVDLGVIVDAFKQIDWNAPLLEKLGQVWEFICIIIEAVSFMRYGEAGDGDEKFDATAALDIAAEAIDRLIEFKGSIGRLLELADGAILQLIIKGAYEFIRNRKVMSKEDFIASLISKFAKI